MRKNKNKKLLRKIELVVKLGISIIIMTYLIFGKQTSTPVPTPPRESLPSANIISMNGLSQEGIPTGCESVSTVALLQHLGITITIDKFIADFLPCKSFYRQDGFIYGPDPHEYFAGNPYEKASLGCFPEVIIKALRRMKSSGNPEMEQISFRNVSGTDLQSLQELFLEQQIPVLLWVTMDMKESREGMKYLLEDGSTYTWTAQEHCVVLCGYDENRYYLMDPLTGGAIVGYEKELVETRYNEMHKNALVILREE